jgi:hypothetical protein
MAAKSGTVQDQVDGTLDGVMSDLLYARARLAVQEDSAGIAKMLVRLASELSAAAALLSG